MAIVNVNKGNYDAEIINSDKPVLLNFCAPWCGPCRVLGKVLEELDGEQDAVKMAKLDIEESPEIAASLGVLSIPMIIYFKEGKVVKKLAGMQSKKNLLKLLAK